MNGSKVASIAGSVAVTVAGVAFDPMMPWMGTQQGQASAQAGGQAGGQSGGQAGGQSGGQAGGQSGGSGQQGSQGQQGAQEGQGGQGAQGGQGQQGDGGQPGGAELPEGQDVRGREGADLPGARRPGDRSPLERGASESELRRRGAGLLDRDETRLNGRGSGALNRRGGALNRGNNRVFGTNGLNEGSPLFRADSADAERRMAETALAMGRLEQTLAERNAVLLRRLGEARQLSGERKIDALADVMQDVLLEQEQWLDYIRQVRVSLTGDEGLLLDEGEFGDDDVFRGGAEGDLRRGERTRGGARPLTRDDFSPGGFSGGAETGNAREGGNATGGNATGGNTTGSNATGGNATGGNAEGGNAAGGGGEANPPR